MPFSLAEVPDPGAASAAPGRPCDSLEICGPLIHSRRSCALVRSHSFAQGTDHGWGLRRRQVASPDGSSVEMVRTDAGAVLRNLRYVLAGERRAHIIAFGPQAYLTSSVKSDFDRNESLFHSGHQSQKVSFTGHEGGGNASSTSHRWSKPATSTASNLASALGRSGGGRQKASVKPFGSLRPRARSDSRNCLGVAGEDNTRHRA